MSVLRVSNRRFLLNGDSMRHFLFFKFTLQNAHSSESSCSPRFRQAPPVVGIYPISILYGSVEPLSSLSPPRWSDCRAVTIEITDGDANLMAEVTLCGRGGLRYPDQIRSVAQSCPTLCHPMNRSTPGLPDNHKLTEFTETHVHRVSDAIQPSHPLLSPSPLAPNPSQHHSLFQ